MYQCPDCGYTSESPGDCPTCGIPLVETEGAEEEKEDGGDDIEEGTAY